MSRYVARPYKGLADLRSLIQFSQRVRAASTRPYYHPGDLVWQLYAFDSSDDVQLWLDVAGVVVACSIFEPPLTFQFDIAPAIGGTNQLTEEILLWADQRRAMVVDRTSIPRAYQSLGSDTLSTSAMDSDATRVAALTEKGYVRRDDDVSFRTTRSLVGPIPSTELPDGARFRKMAAADAPARAELHRDAWSVWGESQHSTDLYRRLRRSPLYDPDLDVVLEYNGQLVSYCLCWLDIVNRVGLFEPVGTRPSATRRGFGRAVLYEALRRLRDKGMTNAIVNTGTVNKPAAALYASAGFEVAETEHSYSKADTESRLR